MTILRSVIEMPTDLLAVMHSNLFHCRAIGPKSVSDHRFRCSVSLHGFLQKPKRGRLIPGFGDVAFQHFALVIDGAPEIMLDAIDLYKDLIKMPLPLGMLAHVRRAFGSDLSSKDQTKSIDPSPDAFMADIDPALVKEVFDISQ